MTRTSGEVKYLSSVTNLYHNTSLTYYDDGAKLFDAELSALKTAKNFIFLEFFTIKSGFLLNQVIDVLEDRARHGVKIFILYDHVGSLERIKKSEIRRLKSAGIRIQAAVPLDSRWIRYANNRDHSKIIVVDGRIAFTGGINLSDIYIHKVTKFGYWKDAGVKIRGDASRGLAEIFVKNWNLFSDNQLDIKYYLKKSSKNGPIVAPLRNLPKPLSKERVARNAYLNLIHSAKHYIYLSTPYFVCDKEMLNALCLAAKRGVKVTVITPFVPDHILTYHVGKSQFRSLLATNVRVYQYIPGLIHAKNLTADGKSAIIGSINYDYRSLNIDFEVGIWTNAKKFIHQMEKDFQKTIKKSGQITEKDLKKFDFLAILGKIIAKQL